MYKMIDMQRDDEEMADAAMPIEWTPSDYPPGLCICLTADEMTKLGIDPSEATVGSVFIFHAMARVTNVSSNEGENGSSFRLEAQIEQMDVDGDEQDDAAAPAPSETSVRKTLKSLYKGM